MIIRLLYKVIYLWEGMIWTIKRNYILRKMGTFGKGSSIGRNWSIPTPSKVFIGDNTSIGDYCRLQCVNSEISSATMSCLRLKSQFMVAIIDLILSGGILIVSVMMSIDQTTMVTSLLRTIVGSAAV